MGADPELQFLLPAEGDPPDFPSDVGAINYPVMIPQASVSNLAGIIKAVKSGYTGGYKAFGPGTMHGSDGMDSVPSSYRKGAFWVGILSPGSVVPNGMLIENK